jgi:hypothetical protein
MTRPAHCRHCPPALTRRRVKPHASALVIALVLAAGCTQYAQVARRNAPGTIDISAPIERENGADDVYVQPEQPSSDAVVVWLHPSFGGGLLRRDTGFEFGFGVSIEATSDQKGSLPIANRAWGVSAGVGLMQLYERDDHSTDAQFPFPLSLEAYHRRLIVMFAAGAVFYPDTRDVGAQITLHAPLTHVRFRYVQDSGFEAMLAWDLNFPVVFGWSR